MNEVQARWREREQLYTQSKARAVIDETELYELYSEINTREPSKVALNVLCTLLDEHPEYFCDDLKLNGDQLAFKCFHRHDEPDAQVTFCNTLSARDGLSSAYTIDSASTSCDWEARGYRLLTEAEWEYAARGGSANDSPRVIAVFCRSRAEPERSSLLTSLRLMRRAD